jgi:hypothetical protein
MFFNNYKYWLKKVQDAKLYYWCEHCVKTCRLADFIDSLMNVFQNEVNFGPIRLI